MKSVLLYKDTENRLGLPGEYPSETKDVPQDFVATAPWVVMTDAEVESRIAQYSSTVSQITQAAESVPQEVERWKLRAALKTMGYFNSVEAVISAIPEPQQTILREKWAGQETVQRNHPTIIQLGTAIGLSSSQIDDVFKTANAIQ